MPVTIDKFCVHKRHVLILFLSLLVVILAYGLLIFNRISHEESVSTVFDEDAFYYLAISRNIAEGRGITIDGSHWTNGFQPLWVFLITIPYLLFSNDRIIFSIISLFSALLWLASGYFFGTFVTRLIRGSPTPPEKFFLKSFFAFLFLADPDFQGYFFNGLETGLYAFALIYVLLCWPFLEKDHPVNGPRSTIGRGLSLGTLMLIRNDAVFFAAPFFLQLLLSKESRLKNTLHSGLIAAALVTPWLVYNYALTGSVIPQSGIATAIGPSFNPPTIDKLQYTLATILRLVFPPLFPAFSFLSPYVTGAMGISLLCCLAVLLPYKRIEINQVQRVTGAFTLGIVGLVVYYYLVSGATWFYARYFMPLKLVFLTLQALALFSLMTRLPPKWGMAIPIFVLMTITGLNVYRVHHWYGRNVTHMGRELAALVVSPAIKELKHIGMFESGRAGYRLAGKVINLDGKTNLEALEALRRNRFLDYLLESGIDGLCIREYHLPWLDTHYPGWREHYHFVGRAAAALIFKKFS